VDGLINESINQSINHCQWW